MQDVQFRVMLLNFWPDLTLLIFLLHNIVRMKLKSIFRKHEKQIFLVLDIALNGFNYFFHIIVSRASTGNDYGRFNALLSLASILFVTGISFQNYISRTLSQDVKIRKEMHSAAFNALILSMFLIGIVLVFHNPLETFIRSGFLSLGLVLAIFMVNLFLSIIRGIFQAREQYYRLNVSFYLEVISKIAFLFIIIQTGMTVEKALLSILCGMIIAFLHALIVSAPRLSRIKRSWRIFLEDRKKSTLLVTMKKILLIIAGNIFLYYFIALDMLIVNKKFPADSGVFAVVLRYSQLVFFVGFSLFAVLTPRLNKAAANIPDFRKEWKKQLIALACIISISAIGYKWIFPYTVIPFFGDKFSEAGPFLPLAGITYSILLLIFYQVNVFIALRSRKYLFILIFLVFALPVALVLFADTIRQILLLELVLFSITFILLFAYAFFSLHKQVR